MNKIIVALGTLLMLIVTAWALPITIKNPTSNNILMTCIFGLITVAGIYIFARETPKQKQQEQVMQGYTPVE